MTFIYCCPIVSFRAHMKLTHRPNLLCLFVCGLLLDLLIVCLSFLKLKGTDIIIGTEDACWVNPKCQLLKCAPDSPIILCWNDVISWWCHHSCRLPYFIAIVSQDRHWRYRHKGALELQVQVILHNNSNK